MQAVQTPIRPPNTKVDFPSFHIASDAAAARAQKTHLRMVRAEIAIGLTVAFIAFASTFFPDHIGGLAKTDVTEVLTVALFAASLLLSTARATQGFDRRWTDSRAAAETVKTLTWQYMMRIPPYAGHDEHTCKERFLTDAQEAMRSYANVDRDMSALPQGAEVITPYMQQVRGSSLADRKAVYVRDRIRDQAKWYVGRAAQNQRHAQIWFFLGIAAKAVGLVSAVAGKLTGNLAVYVGAAAALTSAMTALSQIGHSDDLARSYSAAAESLMILEPMFEDIVDEKTFASYVGKAESVLSREYSNWKSRQV